MTGFCRNSQERKIFQSLPHVPASDDKFLVHGRIHIWNGFNKMRATFISDIKDSSLACLISVKRNVARIK